MNWRKSLYSGNGGNCVEVANAPRTVLVRDTKKLEGDRLVVSPVAWRALTRRLKAN